MEKPNFKKIALLGMAGGMLIVSQAPVAANTTDETGTMLAKCGSKSCGGYRANQQGFNNNTAYENPSDSRTTTTTTTTKKTMSETELMSQLNSEGKSTYQNLSSEGKALAMKLAYQDCKGKNDCKGLNSCKTANNSCAGQGGCQGTSPGSFKDKNVAVKVAAKKMAEKRTSMNSYSY